MVVAIPLQVLLVYFNMYLRPVTLFPLLIHVVARLLFFLMYEFHACQTWVGKSFFSCFYGVVYLWVYVATCTKETDVCTFRHLLFLLCSIGGLQIHYWHKLLMFPRFSVLCIYYGLLWRFIVKIEYNLDWLVSSVFRIIILREWCQWRCKLLVSWKYF